MKTKGIIAIVLTVVMFMVLVTSCTQSSGTDSPTAKPTKSPDTTAPATGSEPAKITVGSTSNPQTEPCLWYETDVWQKIQELANVEITDFTYYDTDRFNIMLAGGDMPDFMFSAIAEKLPDIINAGYALDLKPYFDQYPNIDNENFKQRNEIISSFYGGKDNALYFTAPSMGLELRDAGTNNLRGYNVRWDWYKEIGCPEFKDKYEYIDILEQMVANHPETENGHKVYATGLSGSSFTEWYTNGAFTKPAMCNMWTFGGYLYMESFDDGELINGYTNLERSPYWSDMEFYNILYNKGLLDPDSFTMTTDQRTEKIVNGQYAAAMGWAHADLYNENLKNDPNTLAGFIQVPNEASLVFADYHQVTGFFPSNYHFIAAKADESAIHGALSLLNVLHDTEVGRMMQSGFEGEHWSYVDGVPKPKAETIELRNLGGDNWYRTGIGLEFNFGMFQSSFLAADGYPISLFDTDEMRATALNPLQKDVAEFYGVDYPAQAHMKLVKEGKTVSMANCYSELNQSATEVMPTDISRILTQCNDILFEAVPSLVQAKTQEEFNAIRDAVLADLEATGEKTAWEWCLKANTDAQNFTRPIIETLDW